ncbi:glycosyltransferase [Agromyces cerinus]|uniref:Galactofuranosylgalactofuranosylrhamnosyl-N-acetylglucosaminyl-diphospho-decaprenol beta-1,5/1,6-galactofuranosyltransferase n=1 Tax=Agromyces cerinus subsp. cerinus TaxID=232089 RepID=A0A1N6DIC5_9MICO|nr:glycosyltransferase [Agromyces cerinus]SIN70477.1 galactofuranosylgalactofuranosylrhamnosyl-N-acetylglucosaminyl-diphospho-decaprenol beta-1,5/1,6-galactofuranosyltransferase [Agromyces cerinus subsp. cerinus]
MTPHPVVLQRVIFPEHGDPQALPLYLDTASGTGTRKSSHSGLAWLRGRRGVELPAFESVSLAAYFNAFPASYWARWTTLTGTRLRIETEGAGRIIVFRSNARGVIQRLDGVEVDGTATTEFELPFNSYLDGGWLWFDLIAADRPLSVVQADWLALDGESVDADGTATVSITTLNRGDYCTKLLAEIGGDDDAMAFIDRVQVVDQGSERIVENPGYGLAVERLGDRLRVIEQANLGGSGGFSRGMLETVEAGDSDYVILLDDDVEIEPESLRRAIVFANHCTSPTIVGGHMFDMYDKSKLHAFAEGVEPQTFDWGSLTPSRHDLAESNLRQTPWLHRRFDVDYNGWWMSLIPVSIIKEIGLSIPVFIKWDDAEYSLRAREHGYATVSLPGAAVWHVSWVDKDDSHDWQAFFHARNRLVAALLHSPARNGGKLWRENFALDVKNLFTMDYYTVAMRHAAMRNVFEGPAQLHTDMVDRLPRVRALGADFRESTLIRDTSRLPLLPARAVEATPGRADPRPRGPRLLTWSLRTAWRHAFSRPAADAGVRPAAHLPYQDARWFEVPNHDSVLISNAEGSGVTWHVRDPKLFRRYLRDSLRLNLRSRRQWHTLATQYRAGLGSITSAETWSRSLGLDER